MNGDKNGYNAAVLAQRMGLTKLSRENLGNLVLAKAIADRVLANLRRDLPMSVEPAIVYNPSAFALDGE